MQEEFKKLGLLKKEVAQQLDISFTTVNKYIKQELLSMFQEEYHGINCYFVNGANLDAFKRTHEVGRKPSKPHFYHAEKNIALFQLFVKKDEEKEQFIIEIKPVLLTESSHKFVELLESILISGKLTSVAVVFILIAI